MLFRSAWMPAPPEGSEPAMARTRGIGGAAGRPAATAPCAGAGKADCRMDGVWAAARGAAAAWVDEDKRHPFAGVNRTGSTGLDLSRLVARHPVSVPQPSVPCPPASARPRLLPGPVNELAGTVQARRDATSSPGGTREWWSPAG